MALQDLLNLSNKSREKIGLSEERIQAIIPVARDYISFWREYPDCFVDFMQTAYRDDIELTFKLYAYQRIFLRVGMRYKYVYCVFPRKVCAGYSRNIIEKICLIAGKSKLDNQQRSFFIKRTFND